MKNQQITPNTPKTQIIYFISDQTAKLSYLYTKFGIEQIQQQGTCLRVQIFTFKEANKRFQLYIFPRNTQIKSYCQLYTLILPKPDLIIYAVQVQTSIKQTIEWLNLFQKQNNYKIVFFSSVSTYLQRQVILTKLNTLFLQDITKYILFPNFDSSAFQFCFYNVGNLGISMQYYARLTPTFSRLKWIWKKIVAKNNQRNQQISVI